MRKGFIIVTFLFSVFGFSQVKSKDSMDTYKKRVLESTELDFLVSYYTQDGNHASVTGGIGDEHLTDITPTIVVAIPMNADDVLTVDAGISAYTSASSSNLDPFDASGASAGGYDDDDDEGNGGNNNTVNPMGSPWVASSGASAQDIWGGVNVSYSHSSDDRNSIWSVNAAFATEYDYISTGFGGGYTKLFNEKNTELSIKGQVYLDAWQPRYPTEIDSYIEAGESLNNGFFNGVDILDQNGSVINKNGVNVWSPFNTALITDKARNSYTLSLGFSQILSKHAQFSIFLDVVQQKGWLANPMQRVYFADRANYYVGNASSIPSYTSRNNKDVFHLADDIERLPDSRFKIPIGARFNYYINEVVSLRTYYRYYFDDWGVNSHTLSLELPIKLSQGKFTLYPTYRFYNQTAADYFAPYETHISASEFYTSDYDLSKFNSNQYGLGLRYTDIFTKFKIFNLGLKSFDLKYSSYNRSDGLKAGIISTGFKFILD
ncbi:DUF3570 domain-containing protein [Flavivirga amylovorans]|uniref:DUF3570 domain-containing protein n=1 Tax=Flavivirga amylovorans TaxID=870486 RepID=A0ABT8X3J7_9FLAO|nr:DUF3570 domain-containing protein [Flavivirga amylovorans]MDO5988541.1 DUF3570 domain-containing protein [Flavivirga amylovorans]